MEFPYGHHGRHHHRRDDDDNEGQQRFPPPAYDPYAPDRSDGYDRPPPPPQYGFPPPQHVSHEVGPDYGPPPPIAGGGYGRQEPVPSGPYGSGGGYGRQEPLPTGPYGSDGGYGTQDPHHTRPYGSGSPVEHVGHESWEGGAPNLQGGYGRQQEPHHTRPYGSGAAVEHVAHESWEGGAPNQQPTFRVFSKAREDYCLSVRDGKVVLAPANPRDEHQHWIKDMKYSTRVKDQEGLPSFILINKATGEAIKHSIGATHAVRLVPYKPDYLDESVLWTESYDTGEGFRCIRMVNNIALNFDALNGDENHGGVRDGTPIVLWEWMKGKNQRWKIVPY